MGGFEIGVIVGVLILAAVLLDAFVRSRGENKNPYRLSVSKKRAKGKDENFSEKDGFSSELPNGGARVVSRKSVNKNIPADTIKKDDGLNDSVDDGVSLESGMVATGDVDPLDDLASLITDSDNGEDPMEAVNRMLSEKSEPLSTEKQQDNKEDEESLEAEDTPNRTQTNTSDTQSDNSVEEVTKKPAKHVDESSQGDLLEELDSEEDESPSEAPEEVLILHVMSTAGGFKGNPLQQVLRACDLRFADMNIFHRYEEKDGKGAIQFGVMNMVKPGTFDINAMDTFVTPGVTFFLPLPGPKQALKAYDYMVETALCVAKNLHGELKDETHSVVTEQTLEHGRQRVRDFERQRLTIKE